MHYKHLFGRYHESPFDLKLRGWMGRSCKICQRDFVSESAVEQSAKLTGCILCRILQQVFGFARASKGCSCSGFDLLDFVWVQQVNSVLWFCKSCGARLELQLYTLDGNYHPELDRFRELGRVDVRRHAVESTPTDAAMSEVSQWLDTCTKQHPKCHLADNTPLPSRVLEIDASPDHPLKLRLYRAAPDEMVRYICLSYCWGPKGSPVQLTKETLSQFQQDIAWDTLPLTFQHAALLTRQFGVRYLWIDSLCIVQNDSEDWREHCPRMAEIYHNAYITLAASAAPDPQAGLYSISDDEWARGKEIFSTSGGHPIRVFARAPMLDMNTRRDSESLFMRAWAYQERMLSHRILYFSQREMMWECNEQVACQCLHLQEQMSLKIAFSESANTKDFNLCWNEIVGEYSSRNLSHTADRLPALAGIAKRMHSLRANDTYIAGLWRSTLCQDLLWYDSRLRVHARPTWQAPSWSWASVNYAVTFEMNEKNIQDYCLRLSYVSHSCTPLHPTDEGCFGGLQSASLTVKGKLIPTIGNPLWNSLHMGESRLQGYFMIGYDFWSSAGSTVENIPLYTLHVCDKRTGINKTESYYLCLRQVDGEVQTYERVGVFHERGRSRAYEKLWRTISATTVTLV